MPLYEFECNICGKIVEEFFQIKSRPDFVDCPVCHNKAKRIISITGKDWFKPFWHDDIDLEPVYIKSKRHYKEICQEKGLYAKCLD